MSIMYKDGEPIDTDFEAEEFWESMAVDEMTLKGELNILCEIDDCPNYAVSEWQSVDYGEGVPEVYGTYRCKSHPASEDYAERLL